MIICFKILQDRQFILSVLLLRMWFCLNSQQEILRKRICFFGRVQRVGFRFQAQHAAKQNGVTGWVRNEPDGSVTMELQGTERQIYDVVAEIDSDPYIRIERMETKWLSPDPDERGFQVKRQY